jgi:hypothetical protein
MRDVRAVIADVEKGREAGELSPTILMDYLEVGIGAGLAGASVALADAGTIPIEAGLAGAFAIGIVAAILLTLVARRLPQAQPSTGQRFSSSSRRAPSRPLPTRGTLWRRCRRDP